MPDFFSPEPKVINDLFGNDLVYNIPEYQRPYSWDCIGKSDRNNQVNVMWDDLYSYYSGNPSGTYFLGSMVVIQEKGTREYEVIDGQQRLTTLTLLFAAIKSFLLQIKESKLHNNDAKVEAFVTNAISQIDLLIYNNGSMGLVPQKKVKILKSQSGVPVYDEMLTTSMNCGNLKDVEVSGLNEEQKEICARYFTNRDFFHQKFSEYFLSDSGSFDIEAANKLNTFTYFLKNNVNLVFIKSGDFDIAYHIFEILNNRGLPLSNKDLFRNFLIREFDKILPENPSLTADEKWNYLDKNYIFRDDFLGRWVESRNASQQKYSAFNDLKEIYQSNKYVNGINTYKIDQLYDDIKEDLGYYTLLLSPDLIDNMIIRGKIKFLMNAGNVRYTMNLLIALFRHYKYSGKDNDDLKNFLTTFEIFNLDILVGYTRYSNKPIYQAISELNQGKVSEAIKAIELEKKRVDEVIGFLNGDLDNSNGKLLLSKYVWIIESKTSDDTVSQILYFDKASLEHIIPQSPEQNTNWQTFSVQFLKDYTYTIGNMTLLTTRLNVAAKNYDFEKKKKSYAKTKLPVTVELASLPSIDEKYIKERHSRILNVILEDLGLS
jgi:uncharacterized protein with ParB-like and HNH nuclease domain